MLPHIKKQPVPLLALVAGVLLSTAMPVLGQTVHRSNPGITSLLPGFVVLLLIIFLVVSITRRKMKKHHLMQKITVIALLRMMFGGMLLLCGVVSLKHVFNLPIKNPTSIISALSMTLVFIVGGLRTFSTVNKAADEDGTVYADFGRRFWANMIDGALLILCSYLLHAIFDRVSVVAFIIVTAFLGLAAHLFVVWMVTKYHASPGKMFMGLIIRSVDKHEITVRHALLRSSVGILYSVIYLIAFIISLQSISIPELIAVPIGKRATFLVAHLPRWIELLMSISLVWFWSELFVLMFNRKRRALHDFIAGTIVIERRKAVREMCDENRTDVLSANP